MKYTKQQIQTLTHTYEIEAEPLSKFTDVTHFTPDVMVVNVVDVCKKEGLYDSARGLYSTTEKKSFHRFMTSDQLNALISDPHKIHQKDAFTALVIQAVKKEFWDTFKTCGFSQPFYKFENPHAKEHPTAALFIQEVLHHQGPMDFMELVPNDKHLRIIKDAQGKMHAEPMSLNYITGDLDNKTYDLDALAEYLIGRDDIAFVVSTDSYYREKLLPAPVAPDHPEIKKIIEDIPGYNQEEEKTETINLIYYPKSEDIQKILDFQPGYDKTNHYHHLETYIVTEILGTKPFLREPPQEEDIPVPGRRFKR